MREEEHNKNKEEVREERENFERKRDYIYISSTMWLLEYKFMFLLLVTEMRNAESAETTEND